MSSSPVQSSVWNSPKKNNWCSFSVKIPSSCQVFTIRPQHFEGVLTFILAIWLLVSSMVASKDSVRIIIGDKSLLLEYRYKILSVRKERIRCHLTVEYLQVSKS